MDNAIRKQLRHEKFARAMLNYKVFELTVLRKYLDLMKDQSHGG